MATTNAIQEWIEKEAVRTLVDIFIVGMTPDKGQTASDMEDGVNSLLIKLIGHEATTEVGNRAQAQWKKWHAGVRRDRRLRERVMEVDKLDSEAADAAVASQREVYRNVMKAAGHLSSNSATFWALNAAQGAVQSYLDVIQNRYGHTYALELTETVFES